MKKLLLLFVSAILPLLTANAQSINESFITTDVGKGKFTISADGKSAPLLISSNEWPGVIRAFKDLQSDIGKTVSIIPNFIMIMFRMQGR